MSDEVKIKRNGHLHEQWLKQFKSGRRWFAFRGGRRSGKTYYICQLLLGEVSKGDVVNVASMTQEQGRLGAYEDCQNILAVPPYYGNYLIGKSPREIRARYNGGKMYFNSYANSETAKGIACDWLYINEANNFTKQQFTDLMANVRKGVFIDYNPNILFWSDEYWAEEDIITSTWMNNKFLTPVQEAYFEKLKELGDRPDANPLDRRNYLVYYLGVHAEVSGKIFHPGNIQRLSVAPADLKRLTLFCDPSALRGADYFAMVLAGWSDTLGGLVVLEADSVNTGGKELQARKIMDMCKRYDRLQVYVETNGLIGIDFYDYCQASNLPVNVWYSRGNKFERITSYFEDITQHCWFMEGDGIDEYLKQCYDFDSKCEHDDNIDAVASTVYLHKVIH